MESSNKIGNILILKNTTTLYFRMILALSISLYTSRIILQNLGVTDFGIYNVVGGFVTMFGFINGAMVSSTRRYITFAIGTNNAYEIKKTFSSSFYIHLAIGLIVSVFALFCGEWFISNKMNLPPERIHTAHIVLYFSITTIFSLCVTVPHNAMVVAHEKMGTFALISLFDVFLKLIIAIFLKYTENDKLLIYSFLLMLVSILVRLMYVVYCHIKFSHINYRLYKDKVLYVKMITFAGWNSFSALSVSGYQQGTNMLLNIFFSPVINSARAISVQVQGLSSMFISNFQQAVDPQITKNYAGGNIERFINLIFINSRLSFYLFFIIAIPIFFETHSLLNFWLGTYPEYTVSFIRFSLIISIFDTMTNGLTVAVLTVGQIKKYQFFSGIIQLMILPSSYMMLKFGGSPNSVYIINIFIVILLFLYRVRTACRIININQSIYLKQIFLPIIKIFIISAMFLYFFKPLLNHTNTIFNIIFYIISTIIIIYIVGLNKQERKTIVTKIKQLI
ncbi:MAG: MATE family efflux transporter [Muribaculaceae bacterium]|nr:MATE family efflux transporter [Muribaculaceae bacterium]